ncbi:MAG: AtpZ/AtpI family protein [Bacteroidetes bacterium]|nr:AtpZ/AtpI family protein [Bacteroidota bacterium]
MENKSPNSETQEKNNKAGIQKTYREYAPFLTLGFQMAAAVVVFFFLGDWLDNRYGIEPAGKLVGAAIGIIGGLIKFIKSVASITENEKRNQISSKDEH